jgi:hypothetical protein
MANADLKRVGQIKGTGGAWAAGATQQDGYRALFLKLGSAEVLSAFEEYCVFKGKTKERNIRGGKSMAFPITGKQSAAYHQPGTEITGGTNDPSDLNERVLTLDSLMIADAAIAEVDELMAYWPARQEITRELGRALAYEYDKRVARIIFAAANNSTEPLAKAINTGRTGATVTLGADYTGAGATRQAKGDALVNAIFDARIAMEQKDVPTDNLYAVFGPDDYYAITMSSRAINTDFNGGNGSNGTIADGRTLRVAGIPIYSSNHVTQSAYTLVAGDCNAEYAQDLSSCKGLVFHKDCAGVLTLLSPALQVTSGDWNVSHQSTLMVARQNIGMGVLRAECAVSIGV